MKKIIFSLALLLMAGSAFAQTPEEKAAAKAAKAAAKAAEKEATDLMTAGMKAKAEVDALFNTIQTETAKGAKANQGLIDESLITLHQKALEGVNTLNKALKSGNLPDKKLYEAYYASDVLATHVLNPELQKAAQSQPFDTLLFAKSVSTVADACVGQLKYGNPKDEMQKVNISSVQAKLPRILEFIAYSCSFSLANKDLAATCASFDQYCTFPERIAEAETNPAYKMKSQLNPTLKAQLAFNIYYTAFTQKDVETMGKYYEEAAKFDDAESHAFVLQSRTQVYLQNGDTLKWVEATRANIFADPSSEANENAIQNLLAYYQRSKGVAEMAKFADEVLAAAPESKIANYGKGYSLFAQEKFEEALEYYKKTVEIDPNYLEGYYQCGTCLSNIGAANNRRINDDADKGKYTKTTKIKFTNNMTEAQERAANAAMAAANKETQAAMDKDINAKVVPYYRDAIPYFEKVRELTPDKPERWAYELRQCYYVIKDKAKQEEMDKYLQ